MTSETLEQMSDDELRATIERAQTLLRGRTDARKREALEQARATLAAAGLRAEDLLEAPRARARAEKPGARRKLTVGDRYVNPANPAQSWTVGRGRKPRWLEALESSGELPVPVGSGARAPAE